MAQIPTIPVIVIQVKEELGYVFARHYSGPVFTAYVASNPQLFANGISEDDALTRLKASIMSRIRSERISIKMIDMVLDDLIVEQVHES